MSEWLIGFDILKILAAFTVVLIHTSVPNMDWQQMAFACLPPANAVFGIMAGFFLWRIMDDARAKVKEWLGRRIARLLLPYLIWESVYVILNVIFDCLRGNDISILSDECSWLGIVFAGSGSVQLWFVVFLFYAQCFFVGVALLLSGTRLLVPVLSALTVVMFYCQSLLNGGTVMYKFLFISGCCVVGLMLGAIVAGDRYRILLAVAILCLPAFFCNCRRALLWICVFYALSFAPSLTRRLGNGTSCFIALLSSLTMAVYLLHVLVCRAVGIAFGVRLHGLYYAYEPYWLIVSTAVSFSVSIGLVWCFRRFKWLWGA